MSERDVRELWEAVDALRQGQGRILVALAKVEAALTERCSDRARRIEALAEAMLQTERRLDAVERGQVRLFAFGSVAAAGFALAGQWLLRLLGAGGGS